MAAIKSADSVKLDEKLESLIRAGMTPVQIRDTMDISHARAYRCAARIKNKISALLDAGASEMDILEELDISLDMLRYFCDLIHRQRANEKIDSLLSREIPISKIAKVLGVPSKLVYNRISCKKRRKSL